MRGAVPFDFGGAIAQGEQGVGERLVALVHEVHTISALVQGELASNASPFGRRQLASRGEEGGTVLARQASATGEE